MNFYDKLKRNPLTKEKTIYRQTTNGNEFYKLLVCNMILVNRNINILIIIKLIILRIGHPCIFPH